MLVLAVVVALFSSVSSCSKFRRRRHERKAIENEEFQKIRFDILVLFGHHEREFEMGKLQEGSLAS
jgi:hypothetical protein